MAGKRHGLRNRVEHSFRNFGSVVGMSEHRKQHREFVTSQSRQTWLWAAYFHSFERVDVAQTSGHAHGDDLQQIVAQRRAKGVVDLLPVLAHTN